jgi:alpha-glucosidase (family GH31 glycosyl hydrolase)
MVNVENPDYQMCVDNDFLVKNSKGQVRPLQWWHGSGGLLDYTNPSAVEWWHEQMNKVLDVGVDGFKCDGTDPYILEYELFGGATGFNGQSITYQQYADSYYRDFFYHTRERRSEGGSSNDAGLIMSRPVDCQLDGTTKVCWPYSPRDVMYSGWMGDDDGSFNGFRGCMRKVNYSGSCNVVRYHPW